MKVTVLGRWGAYPEAGEATAGYLMETDRHKVLLDCGSGVLANLFRHIKPEELDAAFFSHYHHDHCADLGCLQYASKFAINFKRRVEPLAIYGHNQSEHFASLTFGEYTVGKTISPDIALDLNGMRVSFCQTVHGAYNLAMRFEYGGKVFIYTGDMGPETPFTSFWKGADLILGETSLFEHEDGLFPGHMTTKQTAQLAERSAAKALLLTHFPHLGDITKMPDEAAKFFRGETWLAKLNETYEF